MFDQDNKMSIQFKTSNTWEETFKTKLTMPVMFGFAPFSSSSLATSVRPLYDAHIRAVHPP